MPERGSRMLVRTREVLAAGVAAGHHLGAQVSARLGGAHHQLTIGEREPGAAMSDATRLAWFSACKPILALAVCGAWERGLLDIHAPVCDLVPEFAAPTLDPPRRERKRQVTAWHLLTHTAGFRLVPGVRAGRDWAAQLAAICAAPLEPGWTPGDKGGYHERSGWTLLAELYRRVVDVDSADALAGHLHAAVLAPLGAGAAGYRVPREPPAPSDAMGTDPHVSPPLVMEEGATPRPYPTWHARSAFDPAAGVYGSAAALSALYAALLDGAAGVVSATTLEQMTRRQRRGLMDHTFRRQMDWGLGFSINSQAPDDPPIPYGYGNHASPATFGHGGMQTSIGFADPAVGLGAAIVCNGMPGEMVHRERAHLACEALYVDLGLT